MTNGDNVSKAREIELNVYAFGEKPKGFEAPAYRAALAMAEWKDAQFKEYLEKKRTHYSQALTTFDVMRKKVFDEIINELYGKDN